MENKTKFGIFWVVLTIIMTVTVQLLMMNAYGVHMGWFTYIWFYVGVAFALALQYGHETIKD